MMMMMMMMMMINDDDDFLSEGIKYFIYKSQTLSVDQLDCNGQ